MLVVDTPPGSTGSAVVAAAVSMPVLVVTALIAEIDALGATSGSLTAIVSALSGGGFAVWMGWHVLTKTLPERDRQHARTIQGLLEHHGQQMEAERSLFRAELAESRRQVQIERDARERDANMIAEKLAQLLSQSGGVS